MTSWSTPIPGSRAGSSGLAGQVPYGYRARRLSLRGYGGDFGESFVEDNLKTGAPPFMTNNGIVLADLTWKPVAYEVKEAYAPVRIVRPPRSSGVQTAQPFERYLVINRCLTRHLREYAATAYLREDGVIVAEQPFDLPELAPLASTRGRIQFRPRAQTRLRVRPGDNHP